MSIDQLCIQLQTHDKSFRCIMGNLKVWVSRLCSLYYEFRYYCGSLHWGSAPHISL